MLASAAESLGLGHSSFILHPSSFPLPLSAGFVTPALAIAGAVLVAVPIIIHLLNRRRFRTVQWAAMQFVLAAARRNRRRMRFESWLLLAMRCAVIALAGVALARPVGCTNSALAGAAGREAGLHVLILDNSGSAAMRTNGDTALLDAVKAVASSLVDTLGTSGGRVAVISAAAPASDVVAAPTYDVSAAAAAVDELSQTSATTDLGGALDRAARVTETAGAGERVTVHILTDATAVALDDARLADLSSQLAEANAELRLYRPTGEAGANPAITSLRPSESLVRRGFPVQLTAELASFGLSRSATLAWAVDGRTLDTPTVQVGTEADAVSAGTTVLDALADGQPHVVTAALREAEGGLTADDERRVVVEQVRDLPVLLVQGPQAVQQGRGFGGSLVASALSPGERGYVSVEQIGDLELGGRPLEGYRAIVLAGVGGFDEATAAELANFVRGGGALLLFVGEATTADNYNSVLLPQGLLPGPLVKRVVGGGDEGTGGLVSFDFDPRSVHPYLDAFRNADRSGLDAPAIRQYWQLDPTSNGDQAAEVVLRFAGTNHPAVTTSRLGEGRIVTVLSAAADPEWTLLPLKQNYPAFLHELLRHAVGEAGGGTGWQTVEVGQRVRIPSTIAIPPGSTPRLLGGELAEGRPLRRRVLEDGTALWESDPVTSVGAYELAIAEARYPIVVNFPAEESDLRRADDAAINAAFGGNLGGILDLAASEGGAVVSEEDRPDWGWTILLAVLLLAAGEAAFASHLGRRRA